MPLRVLDGNQTATTLSSVVTGGEHIVAHSVVSLGANAISDITTAVSGSVVSISNFPATQPISGSISISGTSSVTFSAVTISNFPATQTISGTVTVSSLPASTVTVSSLPAISGTVTANGGDFAATAYAAGYPSKAVQLGFYEVINDEEFKPVNNSGNAFPVQIVAGTYTSTQPISGTVTANISQYETWPSYSLGGFPISFNSGEDTSWVVGEGGIGNHRPLPIQTGRDDSGNPLNLPVSGTVTVGNSVTIGSLPTLTPQLPRVTFIDGSGSVTTANTAYRDWEQIGRAHV